MGWVRNDDDMLDHEKWRRAIQLGGDGVLLMWTRFTSWCSRRLTDGEVPADMVDEVSEVHRSKSRAKALQALIDARLLAWCAPGEDSLCLRRGAIEPSPRPRARHDRLAVVGYLQRNPGRDGVFADRGRRAQAQQNYKDRKKLTGSATDRDPIPDRPPRSGADDVPARPGSARPESAPSDQPSVGGARDAPPVEVSPPPPPLEPPEPEAAPAVVAKPRARPPKHAAEWKRVPEDWAGPNKAHRDRAFKRSWPSGRLEDEAEKYRLHDFKTPHSDADRTFHRWIIGADDLDPARTKRTTGNRGFGRNSDALEYAHELAGGGELT